VLRQQSQRRLEAEVAAATAAGQGAVADAVRTHNMALAAVQSVSERAAARLQAELATARDGLTVSQRNCAELEQLCAEVQLARGQLQQQLEQSWKQLEVRSLFLIAEVWYGDRATGRCSRSLRSSKQHPDREPKPEQTLPQTLTWHVSKLNAGYHAAAARRRGPAGGGCCGAPSRRRACCEACTSG